MADWLVGSNGVTWIHLLFDWWRWRMGFWPKNCVNIFIIIMFVFQQKKNGLIFFFFWPFSRWWCLHKFHFWNVSFFSLWFFVVVVSVGIWSSKNEKICGFCATLVQCCVQWNKKNGQIFFLHKKPMIVTLVNFDRNKMTVTNYLSRRRPRRLRRWSNDNGSQYHYHNISCRQIVAGHSVILFLLHRPLMKKPNYHNILTLPYLDFIKLIRKKIYENHSHSRWSSENLKQKSDLDLDLYSVMTSYRVPNQMTIFLDRSMMMIIDLFCLTKSPMASTNTKSLLWLLLCLAWLPIVTSIVFVRIQKKNHKLVVNNL